MTIAVGIFNLFTYTITGAVYLAFLGYLATRAHWIDPAALGRAPVLLVVIAAVVASYLLGHLAYPLGHGLNKVVPKRLKRNPRAEFRRRNPPARQRDFVDADHALLLSGLEMHHKEAASEVSRLRASGLLLRNSAPALLLAAGAAVVEIFTGRHPLVAAGCAVLLAAASITLVTQGRRLGYWASLKTLELSFWLPDVDERYRGEPAGD